MDANDLLAAASRWVATQAVRRVSALAAFIRRVLDYQCMVL